MPPKKNIPLYCFGAFWIVGALLGIAAVLLKRSLPPSTLRTGGLFYFGAFFLAMPLSEILAGEIRTRLSGPAMCSKAKHPARFWTIIGCQFVVGAFLMACTQFEVA